MLRLGLALGITKGIRRPSYTFGFEYDADTKQITQMLGGLSYYNPTDTIDINDLPFHASIQAAVQNENGTINYFLDSEDWSKKADGTASDLTGGDGDVVAVYPRIYEKHSMDGNKHQFLFSMQPQIGFSLHKAFVRGADVDNYICIGVYEGYRDSVTGKLRSISGVTPTTSRSIVNFRTDASAAAGYVMNFYEIDLIGKMMACRYGSFNSQSVIGDGVTQGNPDAGYPFVDTGEANSLANSDGEVAYQYVSGTETKDSGIPKLMCLENLWGHIWKFLDGANLLNKESEHLSKLYLSSNPTDFASNTQTNYNHVGNLAKSNGYIDNILSAGILAPARVTGSSSTGLADYFYTNYLSGNYFHNIIGIVTGEGTSQIWLSGDQTSDYNVDDEPYIHENTDLDGQYTVTAVSYNAGENRTEVSVSQNIIHSTVEGVLTTSFGDDWRVLLSGGYASRGALAGVFCVGSFNASSISSSMHGTRLCRRYSE